MNRQDAQGSFIVLVWTLIGKVKEFIQAPIVPIHPRAEVVADLLLLPIVSRSMQRRQAEEARLSDRVYRFSSVSDSFSSCWSGKHSNFFSR